MILSQAIQTMEIITDLTQTKLERMYSMGNITMRDIGECQVNPKLISISDIDEEIETLQDKGWDDDGTYFHVEKISKLQRKKLLMKNVCCSCYYLEDKDNLIPLNTYNTPLCIVMTDNDIKVYIPNNPITYILFDDRAAEIKNYMGELPDDFNITVKFVEYQYRSYTYGKNESLRLRYVSNPNILA